MKLPIARYNSRKAKDVTLRFLGYNNNPVINHGEIPSMFNMSSDNFPCASPRKPREKIHKLNEPYNLFAAKYLAWIDGTNFVYNNVIKGTVTPGRKSLVEFNGRIIIFPDNKYYDFITDTFESFGTGTYPEAGSVPDIDYACVHQNHIWGVKGNNIYVSALGKHDDWTTFEGLGTDAFATDVASPGDFTGLVEYQNHVVMFKPDYIHESYGYKPPFRILDIAKTGCIDGRSIKEVNNILYFLGRGGIIYAYSGGQPRPVSEKLNKSYISGVAGSDGRKYYISLYDGATYTLAVYDTFYDLWHLEDNLNVLQFTNLGGYLYALTAEGDILKFNSGNEAVKWEIVTEKFTGGILEKKYAKNIGFRVDMPVGSDINIYLSIDNSPFLLQKRYEAPCFKSFILPVRVQRADSYQIKITGTGPVKIYEMHVGMTLGGDAL